MKQKLFTGNMVSSHTININRFIIVNLICFLVLTACATQNKTQKGAAYGAGGGAVAGAIVGQLIGKNAESTLIGAAIGAAVGGSAGAGVNRQNRFWGNLGHGRILLVFWGQPHYAPWPASPPPKHKAETPLFKKQRTYHGKTLLTPQNRGAQDKGQEIRCIVVRRKVPIIAPCGQLATRAVFGEKAPHLESSRSAS